MMSAQVVAFENEEKNGAGDDRALSLIRELLCQLSARNLSSGRADAEAEELLLDVEVDGVRCVLIRSQPKAAKGQVALSPREQEIARMVAKGYPNKIIADVLDISSWTVCTHLRRIFAKIGVGTRAAMVARLFEEGSIGDQPLPVEKSAGARRAVLSR